MSKKEHVYVIAAPNGFVKIGRAASVYDRYSMIQCNSPLPLQLAYVCECEDAKRIETIVQRAFAPYLQHGEWFEASPVIAVAAVRMAIAETGSQTIAALDRTAMRTERRGIQPRLRAQISEIEVRC